MNILAQRLKQRAKQLGISNAEAARRIGLDERRYAHYASARREPDLATLTLIARALTTTPNWLLGVQEGQGKALEKAALVDRILNATSGMTKKELELSVIQAEAVVAAKKIKTAPAKP